MNRGISRASRLAWTRVDPARRPQNLSGFLSGRKQQALPTPTRWHSTEPAPVAAIPGFEPPIIRPSKKSQRATLLPISCPGCGALTQLTERKEPGFYSLNRRSVTQWTRRLDPSPEDKQEPPKKAPVIPYCDRCNILLNNNRGVPVVHPTVESIDAIIRESPHRSNHIYHVIDAADFPMSLIKTLDMDLTLANLRTRNRRAKRDKYRSGRKAHMSFVITRADLLAPQKEQADALLPKLTEMLRKALGKFGNHARLGNIRLVSTTRGWWTKKVKEDIWKEGGGHWLVGKVNVGKSMLYQVIFPKKKREEEVDVEKLKQAVQATDTISVDDLASISAQSQSDHLDQPEIGGMELFSLLPPPQPDQPYPVMPIASHLAGTTASPIRIGFGKSRGELIDLPGLQRSSLESHVLDGHTTSLVMLERQVPKRITVQHGSSVIFGGGLVRITPVTEDVVFMVHSFLPFSQHMTSTDKAEEHEQGLREINGLESIVKPSSLLAMKSAGKFRLSTDVTKTYAGPLTRKSDVGLSTDRLPFSIYATDILLEGVGWIEVVAQVRKEKLQPQTPQDLDGLSRLKDAVAAPAEKGPKFSFPEIEVFTPTGKFIGQRDCIGGYALGGPKPVPVKKRPTKPRPSFSRLKRSLAGMEKKN